MAARGVNKVIVVGNLGRDPEVRYTPGGDAIANLTVATSEAWKDKQTGEQKEITEWHRVVAYGRLAQIMGEYLRKGSKVYIEGSLRTRQWEKDGQKHYTTEIRCNEMQMLDSARGGSGSASYDEGGGSNQNYSGGGQPAARRQAPQNQPAMADDGFSDPPFDEDIPF